MLIKELIEKLSEFDGELQVVIEGGGDTYITDIDKITLHDPNVISVLSRRYVLISGYAEH